MQSDHSFIPESQKGDDCIVCSGEGYRTFSQCIPF